MTECHADAKNDEKSSHDGRSNQQTASQQSLPEAVSQLAAALTQQNQFLQQQNVILMELISQNSVLISALVDSQDDEDDDEPTRDMEGKPIRAS